MKPNPPIRSARAIDRSWGRGASPRKRLATFVGAPARALVAVAIGALVAALAGCSHIAQVRESDPGFTAESLRSGGLVVLGVVEVNEIPQVRPPLIAALETVMAATRTDIPLVPAAKVAAALDDSTVRYLLLSFQMQGTPDPTWLNRAADRLATLGRYGVLARVESDKLRYAIRDAPANDPSLQSPSAQIRVTGRDAHVLVQVYDLKTRTRVFEAKYIGAAEGAEPDTLPAMSAAPLGGSASMGGAAQAAPIEREYPRPPALARALEPAFLEFARSLPGGPKS